MDIRSDYLEATWLATCRRKVVNCIHSAAGAKRIEINDIKVDKICINYKVGNKSCASKIFCAFGHSKYKSLCFIIPQLLESVTVACGGK